MHCLEFEQMGDPIELPRQNPVTIKEFIQMHQHVRLGATHEKLQDDLVLYLQIFEGRTKEYVRLS